MMDFEEENKEEAVQEAAADVPENVDTEIENTDVPVPEDTEEPLSEEDVSEEEDEEEDGMFILTDEEGNEYPVTLIEYVDYKEKLYVLLAPEGTDLDDDDEELSIMVMEVVMENEDPSFIMVEDEAIALAVIDEFTKKVIEEADE